MYALRTYFFSLSSSSPSQKRYPQLKFEKVSDQFIFTQLRAIKCGKAVGLDNIPPRLLKDAAEVITDPLTQIINASLDQAKIPADWNAAKITPVYKAGKSSWQLSPYFHLTSGFQADRESC